MTSNIKQRNSNIELIRIIAMFMIISYHYVSHGVIQILSGTNYLDVFWTKGSIVNKIFCSFMLPGGTIGVCLFFIITGYFESVSNRVSLKFLKTLLFYAFVIGFVGGIAAIILLDASVSAVCFNLIKFIACPVTSNMWWYATSYMILQLLVPYINKGINYLNDEGLIIFVAIIWIVSQINIAFSLPYNALVFPVFYYLLGALLRRHNSKKSLSKIVITSTLALVFWSIIAMSWFILYNTYGTEHYTQITLFVQTIQYAFLIPACSCMIFLLFTSIQIKNNHINQLGKLTFGIYLLHDNVYSREIIWNRLFHVGEHFTEKNFIPYSIITIIIVYIGCALLDLGRELWVKNIIEEKYQYIKKRICDRFFVK